MKFSVEVVDQVVQRFGDQRKRANPNLPLESLP